MFFEPAVAPRSTITTLRPLFARPRRPWRLRDPLPLRWRHTLSCEALIPVSLYALYKSWQKLLKVAREPPIGETEYRRRRVQVDGSISRCWMPAT